MTLSSFANQLLSLYAIFFVCKAGSSAVFLSSFVVCMLGNMENSRQNPAGSPEVVKKYLLQYSRLHPIETRIMQCRKGCEQGCQSQAGHLEQQWKGCTVCLRYFWLTSCLFAASTPTSAPTAHDNTVTAASVPVPVLPLVGRTLPNLCYWWAAFPQSLSQALWNALCSQALGAGSSRCWLQVLLFSSTEYVSRQDLGTKKIKPENESLILVSVYPC